MKKQKPILKYKIRNGGGNIPNIISCSRSIAAISILFTTVFSLPFWILYLWCGVSDMIDGPLARKLGTTSELGAKIDSVSDLLFFAAACVKVLPTLSFPCWLWWVIGIIALAQAFNMAFCYFRLGGFTSLHNRINKALGLLLYLFPIAFQIIKMQ